MVISQVCFSRLVIVFSTKSTKACDPSFFSWPCDSSIQVDFSVIWKTQSHGDMLVSLLYNFFNDCKLNFAENS